MADGGQPDIDDSRWEIDDSRHVVGMDCTVEHNGEEAAGEVAAIWSFRRFARARRRRARRRQRREHEQGAGQLREVLMAHPQTLITEATEGEKQVGQHPLSDQLRSNPHCAGRKTWPVNARRSVRTTGLLWRWLKRLAFSASYASCHGVLGRRVCSDTTSMREQANQQNETSRIELQQNSRGTTGTTDEEERGEKSVPQTTNQPAISRNPQTGRRCRHSELAAVRRRSFITTTNWYHSVTIPSIHPTGTDGSGTSVVPLLSSGGVVA